MNPEQKIGIENLIKEKHKNAEKSESPKRNERKKLINETEIKDEERKLEVFSRAIGEEEYYICGGLGLELKEGKIAHHQEDIDIIVFSDSLKKVKENLRKNGFIITSGRGWGGHTLDARNFEITEESDELQNEKSIHIGIFIYERNNKIGVAEQIEPDGSVNKKFPLKYFNKEEQALNYKESNLIVADFRLIVSLKMISERPKDIKDIERIKPLLKSKYNKQEIEELKDICKNNLKTSSVAGINHIFDRFLEKGEEIAGENICNDFVQEIEKSKAGKLDEKYDKAIMNFMEKVKGFSISSKENAKKEFREFVEKNIWIISEAQNKLVDEILEL